MFLYELAASHLAPQFAAFMPLVGSPHRGFNRPPRGGPVPFFGLWGRTDDTIPPIANPHFRGHPGDPEVSIDTRYGGWYFVTATAIATAWARANGCLGAAQPPTPAGCTGRACALSIAAGAECVGWSAGCADGASVVRCYHPGGHEVPAWAPTVLSAFMEEHPRRPLATRSATAHSVARRHRT